MATHLKSHFTELPSFLAQEVSVLSCIFHVPNLESAITLRTPGSPSWEIETKVLSVKMLITSKTFQKSWITLTFLERKM